MEQQVRHASLGSLVYACRIYKSANDCPVDRLQVVTQRYLRQSTCEQRSSGRSLVTSNFRKAPQKRTTNYIKHIDSLFALSTACDDCLAFEVWLYNKMQYTSDAYRHMCYSPTTMNLARW